MNKGGRQKEINLMITSLSSLPRPSPKSSVRVQLPPQQSLRLDELLRRLVERSQPLSESLVSGVYEAVKSSRAKVRRSGGGGGGEETAGAGAGAGAAAVPHDDDVSGLLLDALVDSITLDVIMELHKLSKTNADKIYEIDPAVLQRRKRRRNQEEAKEKEKEEEGEEGEREMMKEEEGEREMMKEKEIKTAAADKTPPPPPQKERRRFVDVWGRIPPKDPGHVVCDACKRLVSVVKFAAHLDRCLNPKNIRVSGRG